MRSSNSPAKGVTCPVSLVLACSDVPELMNTESVSELYQLTRLPMTKVNGSASFRRKVE
ncbi:hypothetical protein D3C78_1090070 [compost metagenome]